MKILIVIPATPGVKNVVRDFIYGCWCKGKRIGGMQMPPLNLLYAATVLTEDGNEVDLVDGISDPDRFKKALDDAQSYEAMIVLVSTSTFHSDTDVLAQFKDRNPKMKSIIFGPHPTFMPCYSLAKPSVDIIVQHEPEFILRDVIRQLRASLDGYHDIRGIGFRTDGQIILNEPYPYLENLDNLPFPNRKLLPPHVDYFNPVVKRMPYTTAITSRGCPGRCIFCTVPNFYGKKYRSRSAENVLQELEIIVSQGYREVMFRDETFTAFPERNRVICREMIRRGIDLLWICNARVGSVTRDVMALMKDAGCHLIKFGVESGVQHILDNLKKGIRAEKTIEVFRWAKDLRIDTHAHIMLGNPGETKETLKTTIEFVKRIEPKTVSFGLLTPYPGTDLFEDIVKTHPEIKDGSSCDLKKLHTTAFFNEFFTSLDRRDLESSVRLAYRKFYLRPQPLLRFLKSIDSLDELWRLLVAGANIFSFTLSGDEL
jgi:radical SAM superfamily enzyme YgiQ (UPF0313 family)